MADDPRTVVLALAEHEEAMSALYSSYAAQYPRSATSGRHSPVTSMVTAPCCAPWRRRATT